ncbi:MULTISPECIES: hypothetical protein [unclassified Streptomyces]|uniref:hypothetical protein n=1 Tax=unclassified Streptomyces TaxID=2593676 RepID=UPI003803CE2E
MADPKTITTTVPADSVPRTAGLRWDVVRITLPLGLDVVARCRQRGVLGPVWITPARGVFEVLVAPGTAPVWPALRGTTCAPAGIAPAHSVRRWVVPPADGRPATDAYVLAEVITTALVRRALDHLSRRAVAP